VAREAEDVVRSPERVARESEGVVRGPEHLVLDPKQHVLGPERRVPDPEDRARGPEQHVLGPEQRARAPELRVPRRVPDVEANRHLALAGAVDPRRRRPQRLFQRDRGPGRGAPPAPRRRGAAHPAGRDPLIPALRELAEGVPGGGGGFREEAGLKSAVESGSKTWARTTPRMPECKDNDLP